MTKTKQAEFNGVATLPTGQPLMIAQCGIDRLMARMRCEHPDDTIDHGSPVYMETSAPMRETHVAIIDVRGLLMHDADDWDTMFGGCTNYSAIGSMFRLAMADDHVREIVLNVNSPGGECHEVFDLADKIFAARGDKRITALINETALSAAYAIASAADEIILTRTAEAGSIGVRAIHLDQSALDDMMGLRYTVIKAGARKDDFDPHRAMTRTELQILQSRVDGMQDLFVATVARNRGLSEAAIRKQEAAVYIGQNAIDAGLADRIMSMDDAWSMIISRNQPTEVSTMAIEPIPPPDGPEQSMHAVPPVTIAAPSAEESAPPQKTQAIFPPVVDLALAAELSAAASQAGVAAILPRVLGLPRKIALASIADAQEIKALCASCGKPEKSDVYLAAGTPLVDVRKDMLDAMIARSNSAHVSGALPSHLSDPAAQYRQHVATDGYGWGTAFAKARGAVIGDRKASRGH